MIEIQIAKNIIEIKKLANLGIKYHLYQNESWEMYWNYCYPHNIIGLGILSHNSIPVCACMLVDKWYSIGTYTTIEYRNRGFGRKLVQEMYDQFASHPRKWAKGISGSEVFYKKVLEVQYAE